MLIRLLLLFGLATATPTWADEVEARVRNLLSEGGPVPNSQPEDGATAGQFESAIITSGGHLTAAMAGSSVPTPPSQGGGPASIGTIRMHRGVVGIPFASGVPDYAFGDQILPPSDVPEISEWRNEPVRPGEEIRVHAGETWPSGDNVVIVPEGTEELYYYSPHADMVYASEPGQVEIYWRSRQADAQGFYTVVKRTPLVSIVPNMRPRRLFWTEQPAVPFNTIPFVNLGAAVQEVHIAFRRLFPATTTNSQPGGAPEPTVWQDNSKALHAQGLTGRLLMEFLGGVVDEGSQSRVSLGTAVVDVLAAPVRSSTEFTVNTYLGEAILPANGDVTLLPEPKSGLGTSPPFIAPQQVNNRVVYHAEVATRSSNDVVIFWNEVDEIGITWPFMRNLYNLVWPEEAGAFALNALKGDASATPVNLFSSNNPTLVYQDDPGEAEAQRGFFSVNGGEDGTNRALLRFSSTNGTDFWYLRVYSANFDQFEEDAGDQSFAGLSSERVVAYSDDAIVGERIPPPPLPPGDGGVISRAGYILPSGGTAYDIGAYVDPLLPSTSDSFSRAEAVSEIIPVNALPGNDQLTVWRFRKVLPPSPSFRPLYWPSIVAVYDLQWRPVDPDPESELVMARNNGTGDLPPGLASGFIYFQNDPDLHGYNPNEEHALMLGGRAYALRDDLNKPDSSPPRVLVSYTADDRRPAMRDFVVLRERAPYFFDYPALAGTLLQAPAPLPFLPLPVDENGINHNSEILGNEPDAGDDTPAYYDSFAFEDRKSQHWVYRGPHAGGTPFFQMRYAYKTQPGFAFPHDDSPPDVGSIQPFLRNPDGVGGYLEEPLPVTFRPTWPENVPVLQFGQTLAKAQFGLPAVRGQTSLQVVYEQSRAQSPTGDVGSVSLFDPTRAKHYLFGPSAALETLPPSIATDSRNGKIYFQNLPPHLKERFYFDPIVGMDGALVLEGRFVDDVVGDDYLLLNVLSGPDLEDIQSLVPASDGNNKLAWDTLVQELTTTVETFVESPTVPGTYVPEADFDQTYDSAGIPLITHPDQAVDSYAMAAVGDGQGYVTLASGNGEAFTPENEPVSFHIIRVDVPMNRGQLKIVASSNPLDEQVTLRHSGDFAANPQLFDFEWRYSPPMDGVAPILDASSDNPGSAWIPITEAGLLNTFVVRGAGIQTLSDNYWILRYRPKSLSHPVRQNGAEGWSEWTDPALVEGYIKRALAGINPFNQRVTDFFNNAVDTNVSILTQAGSRWEGNIALNLSNINEFGLIEIYETILNRGIGLSIDGTPPLDYGPANDALLLAAGYLSDLYSILGEEASADAANPTIAFDAQAIGSVAESSIAVDFESVYRQTSTARFAFQGQVSNLLEEELHLLRGRDDSASPGVELSPAYNRLYWNYTRGINAGEVIYALNYNIRERQEDSADGRVDALDAQRMFPQGHGDAYGHHLTALTGYYRLLTDPQFTWAPRVEAVNVLGVPVQVDYLDERKFAGAAARLANTASQILDLVHRQVHTEDRSQGWRHLREGDDPSVNFRDGKETSSKRTRHWGFDEWAARGAQSAYFNWVVANAIVPAEDNVHTGIQKIDRDSVVELDEIALISQRMQTAVNKANAWLNPLGLEAGSTLFDISPTELAAGKTHFEQINDRAVAALNNAFDTFDQATASTRLLRSLENQADDLSAAVFDQERAFNAELLEIYGTPYAGDIGPGKTYPQGYEGPDLFRYFFIQQTTLLTDGLNGGEPFEAPLTFPIWDGIARQYIPDDPEEIEGFTNPTLWEGSPENQPLNTFTQDTYVVRPESLVQYASPEMGRRLRPGRIQTVLNELTGRRETLIATLADYQRAHEIFNFDLEAITQAIASFQEQQGIRENTREDILELQGTITALDAVIRGINDTVEAAKEWNDAATDGIPQVLGFLAGTTNGSILDPSSVAKGIAENFDANLVTYTNIAKFALESTVAGLEVGVNAVESDLDRRLEEAGFPAEYVRMGADLEAALYEWWGATSDVDQAAVAVEESRMELAALISEGNRIQRAREIFRKRAAAITQGYRTRDVAFRTFRTEALEQYQTLLEWAARYAYLAAKAYDYETGLLGTPRGHEFLNELVGSRALGLRNDQGKPLFGASTTGDPGIAGLLAKLDGDWSSVKTRLGFNNPDTSGTVFSLRRELFRIPDDTIPSDDSDGDKNNDSQADKTWKEQLQELIVQDLRADPDVALHCLAIADFDTPQAGLVIPFSSAVLDGFNFFGRPLAGQDHNFSSTSFATKIHSIGLAFIGYEGQDAFSLSVSGGTDLAATPHVYLIPTGEDVMRTPPFGHAGELRIYRVRDYALPLPHNIGGQEFRDVDVWTGSNSLTEGFLVPRKHQAFRAVSDPQQFFSPLAADYTNRRLVGRSVWNTGWKIVIPGQNLLHDATEGLNRFLRSVTDIKLFIRSYSYSGN